MKKEKKAPLAAKSIDLSYLFEYKTKSEWGFSQKEIDEVLKDFPDINMDYFNEALMGITGMMEEGEFITYPIDLVKAIRCGITDSKLKFYEWD